MKYISIDIETTGLNPEQNKILSIGAVIEDTENQLPINELPKFYGVILHETMTGSPKSLSLNSELIKQIAEYDYKNQPKDSIFYEETDIADSFAQFCYENGLSDEDEEIVININNSGKVRTEAKKIVLNCAGKNFGSFDRLFLQRLPKFKKWFKINHRFIDPSILYVDWANDKFPPSLSECKKRALEDNPNCFPYSGEFVTHNALYDALDVVMLIRNKINKNI
jgi:hypothetical protein